MREGEGAKARHLVRKHARKYMHECVHIRACVGMASMFFNVVLLLPLLTLPLPFLLFFHFFPPSLPLSLYFSLCPSIPPHLLDLSVLAFAHTHAFSLSISFSFSLNQTCFFSDSSLLLSFFFSRYGFLSQSLLFILFVVL